MEKGCVWIGVCRTVNTACFLPLASPRLIGAMVREKSPA